MESGHGLHPIAKAERYDHPSEYLQRRLEQHDCR